MANIITLNFEDCYCDLSAFYENVAKKLSFKVTDKTEFDCRKICVSKSVQETIWLYYREEENMDIGDISMRWLSFGPKANLDNKYIWYTVKVEDGFITSR